MFAQYLLIAGFLLVGVVPAAQSADCNAAAQAVAAQYGGETIWAGPVQEGGATVCEVKVKIPGKQGQPPRLKTVRVPG